MKKEKDLSVAVLIDGDNASSEKMEDVMRFVSRYGNGSTCITVDYILCRICRNKWSDTYEKKIYCCYSRSSSFVYMLCQLLYGDKIFIIWLT